MRRLWTADWFPRCPSSISRSSTPDGYCLTCRPCWRNSARANQLHLLHHRTQPHRRHRARADHRRARSGETHHRLRRRTGGGELMRKEFRDSINTAVHNPNLTGALGRFSEAYRISREKAYEGIDFEAVRAQIAERKGYAASHLDELAETFTRTCRGTRCPRLSHRRSRAGARLHPQSGAGRTASRASSNRSRWRRKKFI